MQHLIFVCSSALAMVASADHIRNGSFDEVEDGKPIGWSVDSGIRVESGFGHNGSVGMIWESETKSTKFYGICQPITGFAKGDTIRFSALVKKENFTSGSYGAQVLVELRDKQGKWIAALYSGPMKNIPNGEWVVVKGSGVLPQNVATLMLKAHIATGSSGKFSVDNIVVERVEAKPVSFVTSDAYQDVATKGKVRFCAALEIPKQVTPSAFFSWKNNKGQTIRVKADKLTADAAMVTVDVKKLALGTQTIKCELVDADKVIGDAAMTFTRVNDWPKRRVWIDEHRRCIVDGKPFFPIGIYAYPSTQNLNFFTNGAFNCIIHYKLADKKLLDQCAERGILTFSSLDRKLDNATITKRISEISNHPALLGWYIGDEFSSAKIDELIQYYQLIRTADNSQHPIYIVQDRTYDLRGFVRTADVIGLDPYPVAQRPLRVVTDFMNAGKEATFDSRVNWSVPQTFNWAWYRPDLKDKERFPTEAEMRSMIWQHIAAGANGIISFNLRSETAAYYDSLLMVHREVATMAPIMLSDEKVPTLSLSTQDVTCRGWVKDGKLYIVACNLLNTPTKATITIGAPYVTTIDLTLDANGVKFKKVTLPQ